MWERNILRTIYGAKYKRGERKIRTSTDIYSLFDPSDIIITIGSKRIQWLGHTYRMDNSRNAKELLEDKPGRERMVGRSRLR